MNAKQRLMPIVLIFITVISVYFYLDSRSEINQEYVELLAQARDEAEHDIIVDADEHYMKLMDMKASRELAFEIADFYLDKELYDDAYRWYESKLRYTYTDIPETYLYGMDVGIKSEDYKKVFKVYETYTKRQFQSDEIEEKIRPYKYSYRLGQSFDYARPFHNDSDFTIVQDEGLWGLMEYTGTRTTTCRYKTMGNFVNDVIPVINEDGTPQFIDFEGNLKIPASYFEEVDSKFGKVKEFKDVRQGIIPAYNGKIWNYYNAKTHQLLFGGYKDVTVIANDVGAVNKDGTKWALIGTDGKLLTEFIFDEVVLNSEGEVGENGVVFAKQNGKYYMYDTKGKSLSKAGYDAANAFCDDTYASVKKKNKWIFVDSKGKEYDLGNYKEAQSFSHGLAGVLGNKGWGYIDLEGNLVVDYQFMEVQPVSNHGVTNVKTGDYWQMLTFYKENYNRL